MSKKKRIAELLKKYKHAWVFSYILLYVPWFLYLESQVTENYYVIHSWIDEKIPFVEYFIVPYLLWFVFIAVFFLYGCGRILQTCEAKLYRDDDLFDHFDTCAEWSGTTPAFFRKRQCVCRHGEDALSGGYADECISEPACV